MTYAFPHLVVRLNGGFGSSSTPPDRWSSGFRVGIPTQSIRYDAGALQTFANAVHTAASTMHANAATAAGTNCFLLNVSVARVGTNGRYDPAGQLTTVSTGATAAGAGTANQAWNVALSVGLRTAQPRGYASNGRFYYPMLAPTVVTGTGRLVQTSVQNRLNVMATFFDSVNTAAAVYDLGSLVCVMSNVGAGTTEAVTAVRSDLRLDSIERRENNQPPTYVTAAV